MSAGGTGRVYSDGETVPFPAARCDSEHLTHNEKHECKRAHGHGALHKCICGKQWPVPAATAEGVAA